MSALGLVGAGPAPSGAQTDSTSSAFFYNVRAGATPVFVEMQREGYILDPILLANALDTQVNINGTGNRESFASILNPGPLGDFPALVGLAVAGLPPIPYPGYPLSIRAAHPADPSETLGAGDIPGAEESAADIRLPTVRAAANEDGAVAEGTAARMGLAAGLVEIGGVEARSSAEDRGSSVEAVIESSFADVDIAGLIHIDDVETSVTMILDGDVMRATSKTTVGKVTALGAEFVLGDEGLEIVTILGLPAPPAVSLDRVTRQLEQLMAERGLNLELLPGRTVEVPADGSTPLDLQVGGLVLSLPMTIPAEIPIPSIPGVPLGLPVGGGIPTTATIRLASAQLSATAGSVGSLFGEESFGPPLDGAGAAPGLSTGGTSPFSSGSQGSATFGDPSTGTSLGTPGPGTANGSTSDDVASLPLGPAGVGVPVSFDFTPAFRWTMFAALAAFASGWPLVRRRMTGLSVSAADLVSSLAASSRRLQL